PVSWEGQEGHGAAALNPCGQIVDVSRQCGTATFRLHAGSTRETAVLWYFAPEGAKFLGVPTCFGASAFDATDDPPLNPPCGEITGTWRRARGLNTGGYLGQCRVGSDAAYWRGLPADAPADPPPEPPCCRARGTPLRSRQRVAARTVRQTATALSS